MKLSQIIVRPIHRAEESEFKELMQSYHYLGALPKIGNTIWYVAINNDEWIALLSYSAAALKCGVRDEWIGWGFRHKYDRLHLIANNSRFLILPWITVRCLASRLLATVAKQLPQDWQTRYGYRPVLLETFVQRDRFRGTCYRAANWIHVGQTQGRGKLDRQRLYSLPVKDVYLYPLQRHFRKTLASSN